MTVPEHLSFLINSLLWAHAEGACPISHEGMAPTAAPSPALPPWGLQRGDTSAARRIPPHPTKSKRLSYPSLRLGQALHCIQGPFGSSPPLH